MRPGAARCFRMVEGDIGSRNSGRCSMLLVDDGDASTE
jgi:hypothetical protein